MTAFRLGFCRVCGRMLPPDCFDFDECPDCDAWACLIECDDVAWQEALFEPYTEALRARLGLL